MFAVHNREVSFTVTIDLVCILLIFTTQDALICLTIKSILFFVLCQ